MASRLYRDDAVVLRTYLLGEADRIIVLLTRHHGKVRAVAKGVRRTKSRFGARLEPSNLLDIQLYQGRNLDTVSQVECREAFAGRIAEDYPAFTAATAMLETVDKLADDGTRVSDRQFLLLVGALRSLARREHDPSLVLDAYLLRTLTLAGWGLALDRCAICGAPGPHHAFHVASGGLVCSSCRPPGSVAIREDAVALMIFLLAGDWGSAAELDASVAREVSGIVANYLQFHLERGLKSLGHVERG